MNKAEYKKISHDIRYHAFRNAKYQTEKTGREHTTRGILHNIMWWCDSTAIDKYGNDLYKYRCIGDYDNGLIWEKRWSFKGGKTPCMQNTSRANAQS